MNRGDVYWVRFPNTSGAEIQKTRPAVIVTAAKVLERHNRVQVVPLTSNVSRLYPGEAFVAAGGRPSKALGTQVTTVDKLRLLGYFDALTPSDLAAVEGALREQLAL